MAPATKPRGEIAELQAGLQGLLTLGKRTPKEQSAGKREVFRKIVSLVSVGMDMSALFPTMISCANLSPDDLILKKMLYLYITHYATSVPDLALLAINQLHKDCCDQDPTVRGLALRSLCSLRVPNFLEYVCSPVTTGLVDRHPYVRRTAVMGVLKIYHIDPNVVLAQGMLDKLRQMQRVELDPQVLANCLTVLMQVEDVKALASDKGLIYSLINRIKDFSDWSQCQVLELVSHYQPASEAEVFDFLNALEDRMQHANSAVVLSAVKTFLHLTLTMTATHQQVLERVREPLKSLISREDPATTYAVLNHVLLLLQRAPFVFENDYQSFYCRAHDPWYIKKLKMECLAAIACSNNAYDIVGELTEYARDINPSMARQAVKAVGRIALSVQDVSGIIERLLLFLDSGSEALTAEALVQMKDLLRRYPDAVQACLPQLSDISPSSISQPEARAALVWILGQFGQHIQGAPYMLEGLLEGLALEQPCVRLALLTATAQLFFKHPPECRALLGEVLSAGLNDTHQDVHDRALLYYRLLRHNVGEAGRVINPPLVEVQSFSEGMTEEMKDAIFREFNSLSVIFSAPSSSFVVKRAYHIVDEEEDEAAPAAAGKVQDLLGDADQSTNLLAGQDTSDLLDLDGGASVTGSTGGVVPPGSTGSGFQTGRPQGGAAGGGGGSLLDLGNLLGDLGGPSAAVVPPPSEGAAGGTAGGFGGMGWAAATTTLQPQHLQQQQQLPRGGAVAASNLLDLSDLLGDGGGAPAATVSSHPQGAVTLDLRLNPQARVSSAQFQEHWKALSPAHQYEERLSSETVSALSANNHRDFTEHMGQAYIMTMASGGQPPVLKYYFYGQVVGTGALILVEMVVKTDVRSAGVTIKTEATELLGQFIEVWGNCLMGFYR